MRHGVLHGRPSDHVDLELGGLVGIANRVEDLDHLPALCLGERDRLRSGGTRRIGVVEALERIDLRSRHGVGKRLDPQGDVLAVTGDQVVDEQRVAEDTLTDRFQFGVGSRPGLEQVLDHELVVPAVGVPRVQQACQVFEVGKLGLDLLVEGAQALEEAEIEDLGWPHDHRDEIVGSVLALEGLVAHALRIVLGQEGLIGVVDPEMP